jgi:hypothetical protein
MPRAVSNRNKPSVITQTLEIPTQTAAEEPAPKEAKPDFWTYMQQLTPEQWKDHIVYLTRERPKTHMNGVVGGYLAKIVEAFDQEDIKAAYGGYEFSYIMKRGRDVVYSGRFTVEADPRLDKGREMSTANGDGAPAGFAGQFITMLREELERSRGNGNDSTTAKAVEMLSAASDKAMGLILKQVPDASNPATALKDLVAVIKDLGILGGGQPSAAPSIIDTIRTLKELGLIGQQIDPFKNLDTLIGVFDKLDALRGGGGGSRRGNWKDSLVDKGLELVPQVLDTFRQTREANVAIAHDRARAAENLARVQPPAPGRAAVPSVMTPRGTASAPGGAGAEPPGPSVSGLRTVPLDRAGEAPAPDAAAAEVMFETIDRNSTAFTNFIKQTIVEMINRGDHGEQIVDFLDGAKPGFSNTLVQYTPDQLAAYFAMDPILCGAVAHPAWSEVLDEARKYILAEDEEAEPETPAPGAKGKPN